MMVRSRHCCVDRMSRVFCAESLAHVAGKRSADDHEGECEREQASSHLCPSISNRHPAPSCLMSFSTVRGALRWKKLCIVPRTFSKRESPLGERRAAGAATPSMGLVPGTRSEVIRRRCWRKPASRRTSVALRSRDPAERRPSSDSRSMADRGATRRIQPDQLRAAH